MDFRDSIIIALIDRLSGLSQHIEKHEMDTQRKLEITEVDSYIVVKVVPKDEKSKDD